MVGDRKLISDLSVARQRTHTMKIKRIWQVIPFLILAALFFHFQGRGSSTERERTELAVLIIACGAIRASARAGEERGSGRNVALHGKGIEEDLIHSGEFLHTVLDSMNDALSIIDANTFRILGVNRVFLEQYGLKEQEVIGKSCYEITHHRTDPCSLPNDMCPLKETLKTGRHASAEHIHYLPGGEKVFVEVSTSPIRNSTGRTVHVVHIARDITDRKRTEEHLRKYARELGRANRLRDLFTNILTHELLINISAIKNYAQIRSADSHRSKEMSGAIEHLAEKIEEMLRNVSKYDGYLKLDHLETSDQDLAGILSPLVEGYRKDAEGKGMRIILEHEGQAPLVTSPLVGEVFSNILSNALKYAPRGTTIGVDLKEEPKSWIFSCSDEGEGIPHDCKESIFERFITFDKKGVKGIGLGLSIARRIVELLGGSIWVEDNQGSGSIFRVRLPKRPGRTIST